MAARKPVPLNIGAVTEQTAFGPVTVPMALPIQRRMSRKGVEMWMIKCPRCGRIHEHGAGEGGRGLHCGAEITERGDYYVLDASHLPLIQNVREANADLRRRGWL